MSISEGWARATEIRVPGTGVVARATADEIQIRLYRERRWWWFWRRARYRVLAAYPYRLKDSDTLTLVSVPEWGGPPFTVCVNNVPVVRYPPPG